MSVERHSGRNLLLALGALAFSACSAGAAQEGRAAQGAAPAVAAAVTTAPLVTGLPDFTALVETYGPAVVNVQVTERAQPVQRRSRGGGSDQDDPLERFRQFLPMPDMPRGEEPPARGEGSGFIVSSDGYIMTNAHVVKGASSVVVKLIDRREYRAKVIGFDERTDVAVIKIEAKDLPTVRIGDPEKLRPGQWVVAIGSPFGMENSVTAGIVSATSRGLPDDPFVPFIQTDVAVNPGNSGGPLFNLNGEVVGINSQIYSQSGGYMGLSFAIPIDMANNVREQLVSTGKVRRGRIGVDLDLMNAGFAESFGLDRPRGALVKEVVPGEPAEKAGIRAGDVILSVGGKPVESEVTLRSMVAAIKPGTNTELEVWTDKKLRKVMVKVGEVPEEEPRAAVVPNSRGNGRGGSVAPSPDVMGMSVRPLTAEEKQQVDTDGSLVVESVSGAAQRSGIKPGDIILSVLATNVKTPAELQAAAANVTSSQVVIRLQRQDQIRFVQIPRE
ncbi:MAG: Do family serine endopeptidase [Steroidobacteraceae bacterium]